MQAPPLAVIPTGKNAHCVQVSPDNAFVFASNLGSDVILQYRFDPATGTVTPNSPPSVATKAGAGPRHFVFSPDQRFVYSTNELDATVNTYAYNRQSGTLTLQGSDSALPDGFKTSEQLAAADLEVLSGRPDQAFDWLIALIRETAGADRDAVRVRLLELFEIVGPADPAVLKARRDLMSALF